MKTKNYLAQANMSTLPKITRKENVEKAMEDCQSLFWSAISPIHFIVEQEFLKVYDWYEDHNLMRHRTKKLLNEVKKELDKYTEWINENMEQKAAAVPYDLANKIYGGLEKELFDLLLTFKFYFERKGVKDADIKAQLQLTLALFNTCNDVSNAFFDKYVNQYHVNFRNYYAFADLQKAEQTFFRFYNIVVEPQGIEDFAPTKNYASVKAYETFLNKLTDADYVDSQAIDALAMNNCVEELAEIYGDEGGMLQNAKISRKTVRNLAE